MKYLELTEQTLMEINMSPRSLKKLAAGIKARSGMEFEMIVPIPEGIQDYDDDGDYEEDMNEDRRARSLSDVLDFFADADYNSRTDIQELENAIREDFEMSEAYHEAEQRSWEFDAIEYIISEIENSDLDEEFKEKARKEVGSDRSAVMTRYRELVRDRAQESFNYRDEFYDQARETWVDDGGFGDSEQEEALDTYISRTYRWMSDIQSNFAITWPYYTSTSDREPSDAAIEAIANNFKNSIGRPVNWSSSYHGARRAPNTYAVEPDSSLEPNDTSKEIGLEFVAPDLPIEEMIGDLKIVKAWADKNKCYTGKKNKTGLHINVSVADWEGDLQKLDYVKLALLLGDKYVLEEFGRSGNYYCKSALEIVTDRIKQRPEAAAEIMNKMKAGLNLIASKIIHSGQTNKYTSINVKSGYIEFRSPGDDWLGTNFDKIESTLLRFVVALDASVNPDKYRDEYNKKLYMIFNPGTSDEYGKAITSIMDYWTAPEKQSERAAKMAGGVLSKADVEELKALRKTSLAPLVSQRIERDYKANQSAGKKYWYKVYADGRGRSGAAVELVATNKEDAITKALEHWRSSRVEHPGIEAEVVKPYEERPSQQTVAEPTPALTAPDTDPDANWAILRKSDNQPVHYFTRNTRQEAEETFLRVVGSAEHLYRLAPVTPRTSTSAQADSGRRMRIWDVFVDDEIVTQVRASTSLEASNLAGDWVSERPDEWHERYNGEVTVRPAAVAGGVPDQQPRLDTQQQGEFTGRWNVSIDGEIVTQVQAATQGEANARAREWMSRQDPYFLRTHQGGEVTVTPINS